MGISVFELIYIVDLLLNFNRILLEKEYVYDDVSYIKNLFMMVK